MYLKQKRPEVIIGLVDQNKFDQLSIQKKSTLFVDENAGTKTRGSHNISSK